MLNWHRDKGIKLKVLEKLQTLEFCPLDETGWHNIADVEPLLTWHTLKTVAGWYPDSDQLNRRLIFSDQTGREANIETLSLTRSIIDFDVLEQMLGKMPNLRSFYCQFDGPIGGPCSRILETIARSVGDTLERLSFFVDAGNMSYADGNLKGFTRLTWLETETKCLYWGQVKLADLLPESIEELRLDFPSGAKGLLILTKGFEEDSKTGLPNLRYVGDACPGLECHKLDEVVRALRFVGVAVEWLGEALEPEYIHRDIFSEWIQ